MNDVVPQGVEAIGPNPIERAAVPLLLPTWIRLGIVDVLFVLWEVCVGLDLVLEVLSLTTIGDLQQNLKGAHLQ